jgi:hypothetical protein
MLYIKCNWKLHFIYSIMSVSLVHNHFSVLCFSGQNDHITIFLCCASLGRMITIKNLQFNFPQNLHTECEINVPFANDSCVLICFDVCLRFAVFFCVCFLLYIIQFWFWVLFLLFLFIFIYFYWFLERAFPLIF